MNNNKFLEDIRQKFESSDNNQLIRHDRVTEVKLLDMIFRRKANIEQSDLKFRNTSNFIIED